MVLKFRQDAKLDPVMILNLVQSRGDLTLLPPAVIRLDLTADLRPRPAPEARVIPGKGRLVTRPTPAESRSRESQSVRDDLPGGSWWTARAGSTVQPGFTKGEILAEAPFDPSTPDGLFERLGSLLEQLTQSLVASSDGGRLKY